MPSTATITAFYSFSPGTTIESAKVNTNFSTFRGHILPVDASAASAANNTYDLGSSDYRWRQAHAHELRLYEESTGAHYVAVKSPSSISASYEFRLPAAIGTAGQSLRTDGSNSSWSHLSVVTKTAAYSATASDDIILCDSSTASFTVELPDAANIAGKQISIIKINDTNVITVDGLGGDTIAGRSTFLLTRIYSALTVVSDGTNWQVKHTTEKIYAEYTSSVGQALTGATYTAINYGTKVYDDWGCVTTGTSWAFTAPLSDFYEIRAMAQPAAVASGSQYIFQLYKNGSAARSLDLGRNASGSVDDQPLSGVATINLAAGDTINVRLFVSTNQSLTTSSINNWITISSLRGV